ACRRRRLVGRGRVRARVVALTSECLARGDTMPVIRLRQIYVHASEPDGLARFIDQALGLPLQFRDGDRWIQFRVSDVSIAVASAAEAAGVPSNCAVPVFEVTDLSEMLIAARDGGAEVGVLRDMGDHGTA